MVADWWGRKLVMQGQASRGNSSKRNGEHPLPVMGSSPSPFLLNCFVPSIDVYRKNEALTNLGRKKTKTAIYRILC